MDASGTAAGATPADRLDAAAARAERALLGAVLCNPPGIAEVADVVAADDFLVLAHRQVWGVMAGLLKRGVPPDLILVGEVLARTGALWDAAELAHCAVDLLTNHGYACYAPHYAALVKEHGERRTQIAAGLDLIERATKPEPPAQPPRHVKEFRVPRHAAVIRIAE